MDSRAGNSLLSTSALGGSTSVTRNVARPDAVADSTRQCIAFFGRACSDRTVSIQAKTELENQLGRFKIWAGTIGVFAAGKASTDARLKNDEDVKEIMIDSLLRLRKALGEFLTPMIVEEFENNDGLSESSDSSGDSETSLILSIGDESSTSTIEDKTSSHQTLSLQEIDGVISRLYRLSAIIRKPTSLQENVRVASFIEKTEDGPDAAEFASHVRWQIRFRLPGASDKIVDRLVNAVIFRRRKLRYRERHQKKLSQGLEAAFEAEIVLPSTPKAPQYNKIPSPRQNSPFLKSAASVKSWSNTIPLSGTEASQVNRRALASYPKSAAGASNITRSAIARRDQLDVPPPPNLTETSEAICPYCFEVVDKANMARSLWTRHILKDIDPYVCLFEDCSRPDEQYQSFDDWVMHMKWQHTLVWSCQAPRHKNLKFDTSAEYEAHMRHEHSEDFSNAQLALLVEKSAQPTANPLHVITRCDELDSQSRSVCPLCPFSVDRTEVPEPNGLLPDAESPLGGSKDMRDHIAAHLEAIALFSLPEQDNLDNAASDEVQSESAKISNREENQDQEPLFLTSEEWDEYNHNNPASSVKSWLYFSQSSQAHPPNPYPLMDYEDWDYVRSTILPRAPQLDHSQDPVLKPFVERVRRAQTLELQKKLGIPLIIINDPSGLEIPREQWSGEAEHLHTNDTSTTQLHNIGPSSPSEYQRQRYDHEAYSAFFTVPDDSSSEAKSEAKINTQDAFATEDEHVLSEYARKKIHKHVILPIIREEKLREEKVKAIRQLE